MTLHMAGLTRAKNGDWFSRKTIPSDIREAYQRAHGIRQEERFRVPSNAPISQAKLAHIEWLATIEARITAIRANQSGEAVTLSNRQMHELAGRWYDWFIAQNSEKESPVADLDLVYERYQDALEAAGEASESFLESNEQGRGAHHAAKVRAVVIEASRLLSFIAMEQVVLTTDAFNSFVDTIEPDFVAALSVLRRRSFGDYSADLHRNRFPQAVANNESQPQPRVKLSGWNVWQAFEAWVQERMPASSTVNRWRGVFLDLDAFHSSRDIALFTDDDAVKWKNKLMATGNLSGRTANEVYLTAASRVFGWVKSQKKISSNPFEGVKVSAKKAKNTKTEFQEEDVVAILKASLAPQPKHMKAHRRSAIRWVPWICAYTGARPGEITQLRKQDIEQHREGFWTLRILPEAGTVKGGEPRHVPLHDDLVTQGFIDFVKAAKAGPLFYDPSGERKTTKEDTLNPPRPQYVIARQKLGDWVRKLGIDDKRVSPNHSWRHTFKRRAARAGIEQRIRDGMCGHTADHVGAIYELPTVEDLANAIKAFPAYSLVKSEER
ncbi:Tyrosine recombinase XerD [compost metagenome]